MEEMLDRVSRRELVSWVAYFQIKAERAAKANEPELDPLAAAAAETRAQIVDPLD